MRKTTDGPWFWINRRAWRLAAQEGPFPALVLAALASIESEAPTGSKAAFSASLEQIASACGISRRSAHNGLKVLVKIGLVELVSGCNSAGATVRNRYCLQPVFAQNAECTSCTGGCAGAARRCAGGALPLSARGALLYKEKEEEGRPPTGPTRPSSKEKKRARAGDGCAVRLNAAPPPSQKKDMEKTDKEAVGDPWEDYVRQQLALSEKSELAAD